MKLTNDDVTMIEKFIEIRNNGFYASGAQVTEVFNRVLGKNVASTNCSSCIRARITELENALNHYKAKIASESVKEPTLDNVPQAPKRGKKNTK